MRALTLVIVTCATLLVAPGRARAQDAASGSLVTFWAPPGAPAQVAAARDALAARARRAGVAFLDLSPATPAEPLAPQRHRDAIEAYEGLRFGDAVAAADAAIREIDATGADGITTGQLSDLFLYRALAHTQLGDATAAWDDLVRAAVVDPARVLDPLRFPSRAVEAFTRARERVAGLPRGALVVEAPQGCTTRVDAAPAASGRVELPFGDHWVRVTCAGREPWGARVAVAAAEVRYVAAPRAPTPPDDRAYAALAREHRVGRVLAASVTLSPSAPPVLALHAVDARGRGGRARTVALAAGGAATPDAEALLVAELGPPAPVGPVGPRAPAPWWRSPWLWAGAGVALATAVLLPLALAADGDGDAGSVTVSLDGDLP